VSRGFEAAQFGNDRPDVSTGMLLFTLAKLLVDGKETVDERSGSGHGLLQAYAGNGQTIAC
jgi:hypothetical protein